MNKISWLTKLEDKILIIAIGLSLFYWIADSVVDKLFFFNDSFLNIFLFDMNGHELFMRLSTVFCITGFGALCSALIKNQIRIGKKLDQSLRFQQQLLNVIPVPVFYKDEHYVYIGCNKRFEEFLGMDASDIIGKTVFEIAPEKIASVYHEKDRELLENPGVQVYEFEVHKKSAETRLVIFNKSTFTKSGKEVGGLIGAILDITDLRNAEQEREILIKNLQEALDKVKLLSGFIPICASCKKIRDDSGFWNQIEHYIEKHSEAEFSHGICPDCTQKLYPEL